MRYVDEVDCWDVLLDDLEPALDHYFGRVYVVVLQFPRFMSSCASFPRCQAFCLSCLPRLEAGQLLTFVFWFGRVWLLLHLLLLGVRRPRLAYKQLFHRIGALILVGGRRKCCVTTAIFRSGCSLLHLFLTCVVLAGHAHVVALGVIVHHLIALGLMSDQLGVVQDDRVSVLLLYYALPHLRLVSNLTKSLI